MRVTRRKTEWNKNQPGKSDVEERTDQKLKCVFTWNRRNGPNIEKCREGTD